MNLSEMIYQRSQGLPEGAAQEALDFIEFLLQRYPSPKSTTNDKTEVFIASLAGGLSEDFPDNISLDDLSSDALRTELD